MHTYGEIYLRNEIEQCIYNYELANVDGLRRAYDFYESEAKAALAHEPPLVMPAHDYVLKCSHTFNLLDSRGAIGVTERANYFRRMRDLSRQRGDGLRRTAQGDGVSVAERERSVVR